MPVLEIKKRTQLDDAIELAKRSLNDFTSPKIKRRSRIVPHHESLFIKTFQFFYTGLSEIFAFIRDSPVSFDMGRRSSQREEILKLLRDGKSVASIRSRYPSVGKTTLFRWQQELRSEMLTPEPELRSIDEPVGIPLETQFKFFDPRLLERRRLVWDMHCARVSRKQIATQVSKTFDLPNYKPIDVYRDIQHAYEFVQGEYESDLREQFHLEMENLATCHMRIWPAVQEGDLKAIQVALSISDRRCQILGLHKAQRILFENAVSVAIGEILEVAAKTLDAESYEKLADALRSTIDD